VTSAEKPSKQREDSKDIESGNTKDSSSKKLKRYHVGIREVWVNTVGVEARNPEEAKELAAALSVSQSLGTEYGHTIEDTSTWVVEEITDYGTIERVD